MDPGSSNQWSIAESSRTETFLVPQPDRTPVIVAKKLYSSIANVDHLHRGYKQLCSPRTGEQSFEHSSARAAPEVIQK